MAEDKNAEEIQQAVEKQIAELRNELKRISKTVADRSSEWKDRAEDAVDDASGRFRQAAQTVRERGQVVAEAVRENPGTATTLFGTAGVIGFLIGLAVGCAASSNRRRW